MHALEGAHSALHRSTTWKILEFFDTFFAHSVPGWYCQLLDIERRPRWAVGQGAAWNLDNETSFRSSSPEPLEHEHSAENDSEFDSESDTEYPEEVYSEYSLDEGVDELEELNRKIAEANDNTEMRLSDRCCSKCSCLRPPSNDYPPRVYVFSKKQKRSSQNAGPWQR